MPPVMMDVRLVELAALDVLDLRADGSLCMNKDFVARCLAAYEADPSTLDTVIRDHILACAGEHDVALLSDAEELALAVLELEPRDGAAPDA